MLNARKLAEEKSWHVTQEVPHPFLSSSLAKTHETYPESCNLLLESSNAQVKMELLFSWNNFSASVDTLVVEAGSGSGGGSLEKEERGGESFGKWKTSRVGKEELAAHGTTRDKMLNLLSRES